MLPAQRDKQPFGIANPFTTLASSSAQSPVDADKTAPVGNNSPASRLQPDSPVLQYQNLNGTSQTTSGGKFRYIDSPIQTEALQHATGDNSQALRVFYIIDSLMNTISNKTDTARHATENRMIPKAMGTLKSALSDVQSAISDLQGERAEAPLQASLISHAIDMCRGGEGIIEGQITETKNSQSTKGNKNDSQAINNNRQQANDRQTRTDSKPGFAKEQGSDNDVDNIIEQLLKRAGQLLDSAQKGVSAQPTAQAPAQSPASKVHNVFQAILLLNQAESYLTLRKGMEIIGSLLPQQTGIAHSSGSDDTRRQIELMKMTGEILIMTLPAAEASARKKAPAMQP